MSKDEGGRNSSFSEKPVRSRPRRLVDWINPTSAKKVHSLIDKVYKRKNLEMAWEKVKENRGSGGVDGQTLEAFEAQLVQRLDRLHRELKEDAYRPLPVRQHPIPKGTNPVSTEYQCIVPLVPYRSGLLSFGSATTRLSGVKSLIVLGGLDDSLQVFWAFGPRECTGLVVAGDEAVEQFLEILLGMLDAVRQTLLAEDEETFDEVHPRGMRGRVMKVDLRMANQPSPSRLVFVDV